jgi:RNA polymerase sigma factor (sigma-70 family)
MMGSHAVVRQRLPGALLRTASDERLVDQVRAGSERAFEILWDRHYLSVLAFCQHMLGSHEDAEDAVQHTFLAAYCDLSRSEKPIAPRPWLYAIARHRCVSVLRERRERPSQELLKPATEDLAAEAGRREDLRLVLADLARLPDDQRAALVLAQLGGVSHEEIAQVLGCRPVKVRALVFQARSALLAGRAARDTPCAEIREQLATLRGSALRRTALRRHVRDCPSCRAFAQAVRRRRRATRLLLPLAPAVGLKRTVLSAVFGSGGAVAGLGGSGLALTALVVAAIPAGGVAATLAGPFGGGRPLRAPVTAVTAVARAAPAAATPPPRTYAAERPPEHLNMGGDGSRMAPGAPPPVAETNASAWETRGAVPEQAPPRAEAGLPSGLEHAEPAGLPANRSLPATDHPSDPGGGPPASGRGRSPTPAHANGGGAPANPGARTVPPQANGEGKPGKAAEPAAPPNSSGQDRPAGNAEPVTAPQRDHAVGPDPTATPPPQPPERAPVSPGRSSSVPPGGNEPAGGTGQ